MRLLFASFAVVLSRIPSSFPLSSHVLPSVCIGTSSELHRNLIGTSSESHRNLIGTSPYFYPIKTVSFLYLSQSFLDKKKSARFHEHSQLSTLNSQL